MAIIPINIRLLMQNLPKLAGVIAVKAIPDNNVPEVSR
jgi:hypothetical protein